TSAQRVGRFLGLAEVAPHNVRTPHCHLAHLSGCQRFVVLADDADLLSWQRQAAPPGLGPAFTGVCGRPRHPPAGIGAAPQTAHLSEEVSGWTSAGSPVSIA